VYARAVDAKRSRRAVDASRRRSALSLARASSRGRASSSFDDAFARVRMPPVSDLERLVDDDDDDRRRRRRCASAQIVLLVGAYAVVAYVAWTIVAGMATR
jgi:hypothetical protein